jgi:methylenetetrahydrofolate reductase (NADPH)
MKVIDHINGSKRTQLSIEVLPPLKGQTIDSIYATLDSLVEFQPAFVDVTYHREEYVFREVSNGLLEKMVVRKRPGTVGICAAIKYKYGIDPVPHLICGGFSKEETENALIDLNFLGIDNVLVLRGDPITSEGRFKPESDGHAHAVDLLDQVIDMNQGKYLDPDLKNQNPTNFCAGVAGYPEKHFESPSMKTDLKYLKMKVDHGAEYIVTQLFYDNQVYFDFVKSCRQAGIMVPIIPGLKPISTKAQLNIVPHFFHVNLPDELVEQVERAKNDLEVREIGIEWCKQQCRELIKAEVPVLHFYTMGRAKSTYEIAKAVF